MGLLTNFRPFGYHVDFFTDRLCRIYTVIFFITVAVIIANGIRSPGAIECWNPAHFTSSHYRYTEEACRYMGNFHNLVEEVPQLLNEDDKVEYSLNKMRYLPAVLVGQAVLFLLPWIIWNIISGACCSLPALVKDADKAASNHHPTLQITIAKEIEKLKSTLHGAIFGLSYLATKALYWIICFVQMGILSYFLNINFFRFDRKLEVYDALYPEYENHTFVPFPRILICDYKIQRLGNIQNYAVQCMIPVNETIERYLFIIWTWLVVLLIIFTLSGIFHLLKSIFWFIGLNSYTTAFAKQKITDVNSLRSLPNNIVQKFGNLHLKPGVFLALEILEENGSLHAVSLVVNQMWLEFLKCSKISINDDEPIPADELENDFGGQGSVPLVPMERMPEPGPYGPVQVKLNQMH